MNAMLNQVEPVQAEAQEQLSVDAAPYNQTLFAEDVLFTDLESQAEEPQLPRQSKKKLLLLVVLGLFAGVTLLGSIYLQMKRNQQADSLIIQENSQAEQPQGVPALERQLSLLRHDIETADPLESPLAFPPLDFRLSLQDATAIQIQQQLR